VGRPRVALLHEGARLERWHVRCIDELETVAELVGAMDVAAAGYEPCASRLLERYAQRVARNSSVDGSERLARIPALRPEDGPPQVDVVLGLGNVVVPPGIGAATRFGVWRFAHELDGTRLPFFAEVSDGHPVTRAALLRVDDSSGRLSTLESGVFRTETRSYRRSREAIVAAIAPWPARVCGRLAEPPLEPEEATREQPLPSGGLVRFGATLAMRRVALAWERLFRHPQWNIGLVDRPVAALLGSGTYRDEDVDWFPLEGRRRFLADPFAIERGERLQVVCESFDYRTSLGSLAVVDHGVDGYVSEPRQVLAPSCHVSYPSLVELRDRIHCVPETADASEVALYDVGEDGQGWAKVGVLLPGIAGVDPTVFRHDGRWWLMCTYRGPQEDTELWVWHAREIAGPWSPHATNPVKTDVRGARPAGPPFVHEGVLHRPAQDCSTTYGGRVVVHRVDALTPSTFQEQQVAVVAAPAGGRFPIGPHTLTPVGDRVLVDGRRTVFVPAAFRAFLQIWARDVSRRVRR